MTDTGEETVPIELGGIINNVRIPLDGSATMLNISGLGEIAYNYISQFGQSAPAGKA
ncbi:flagellar basal body rod modification protein [Cedecea neteri]|uniref:Flagellar basal body rod modification protein n=1 Tax=Cedecea neteri TaxID=158822 RepID=A0A2X2SUR1_9ENTR|nr:flagellar basal body rod modification protein [Cedecea neteri]